MPADDVTMCEPEPPISEAPYDAFVRRLRALQCESLSLAMEAHDLADQQALEDDENELRVVRGLMLSACSSSDIALRVLREE